MLDFPGTCVAEDNEIAEGVKEKNQRYEEVCTRGYVKIGTLSYDSKDFIYFQSLNLWNHLWTAGDPRRVGTPYKSTNK